MTTTAARPASVTFIRFALRMSEAGGVSVPAPIRQHRPDAVVDTDAEGRPHVPGTSLAGSLRAHVRDQRGEDVVRRWFGHLTTPAAATEAAQTQFVDAVASRVWVLGSRVRGNPPERLTRWSTAIDRTRGAAKVHTLRGEEVLPAGTTFDVYLRWDDADPAEAADLVELIRTWRPIIGRGASRGHGRCSIHELRHGTLNLSDPADLLRWLQRHGPDLVADVAVYEAPAGDNSHKPELLVDVPMTVVGPLHIAAAKVERGVAPLHRVDGHVVVPASSLKGVVRSRMEFVLRSVRLTACEDQRCGTQDCFPCRVFGFGGGNDPSSGSVGARARVRFRDAVIDPVRTRVRQHVAIDRFTGGSAMRTGDAGAAVRSPGGRGGLLYEVEVVESGGFRLQVEPLGPDPLSDAELGRFRALLRLVLADFDDGLIGLGRATARGYGSLRVTSSSGDQAIGLTVGQARAVLAGLVGEGQ